MTGFAHDIRAADTDLLARLTLEQKVRLLTGADAWSLHGEGVIGLRPLVLSDGPAGVRGATLDPGNRSSSLPCPVALAATWDTGLVERLASALGREARGRGIDVLLAPTVNIVRTPMSGRGFECFSEDPLLTAGIAVAYVRGVQAAGVAATVKHYVGNDSETARRSYDARIAEPVLRELYLAPFEACVAEGGVALVMAAYNSVNGATMTANAPLLRGVLKNEWAFDGAVISDWSATWTTDASALAGLDLVMPGPHGPWGEHLVAAVRAGTVPEAEIDDKVLRLLGIARRVGALAAPAAGTEVSCAGSDDGAHRHVPGNGPLIDPTLLREVASRSFVMLRNERAVLPLGGADRRIALIGPNVATPQTQGGGSVRVLSVVRPGLVDALRTAVGEAGTVEDHVGCLTWSTVPPPEEGTLRDPVSGNPGVRLEVRDAAGVVLHDAPFASSVVTWWDGLPEAVHRSGSEVVMCARYRPVVAGPHLVGAAGAGHLCIVIDGDVVAEATMASPEEVVEAFSRPPELRASVSMEAGRDVEVRVEYRPDVAGRDGGFVAMRLGIAPAPDEDALLAGAVEAAAGVDVCVVVVGSADGTESEGYDRDTMALPGRQDELVRRVAAANPRTVVVVNSGMPVLMPWADGVAAIVQAWLPGQAFGEALAACLVGTSEPGGRLPVSMPHAEADAPVFRAIPEAGRLGYDEGLLVGYRGYDRSGRAPRFCFGHGLGYTDWSYESLTLDAESIAAGEDVSLSVQIANCGDRAGREIVQLYLEEPDLDPTLPLRVLAGYAVADAQPSGRAEVRITVRARSFAHFDPSVGAWVHQPGTYTLRAGRSSRDLRLRAEVSVHAAGTADGGAVR